MHNDEAGASIEELRAQMDEIYRLKRERTRLTGIGAAERRRVTVAVNADGIAIDIKFSSDITDLDYDEIAAAITEASRRAVADVAEQTTELFAPIAPGPEFRSAVNVEEAVDGVVSLRDQLR